MSPNWRSQKHDDPSMRGPYALDRDHAVGLLEEFDRCYWQGGTWSFYRAWRPVLAGLVEAYNEDDEAG